MGPALGKQDRQANDKEVNGMRRADPGGLGKAVGARGNGALGTYFAWGRGAAGPRRGVPAVPRRVVPATPQTLWGWLRSSFGPHLRPKIPRLPVPAVQEKDPLRLLVHVFGAAATSAAYGLSETLTTDS